VRRDTPTARGTDLRIPFGKREELDHERHRQTLFYRAEPAFNRTPRSSPPRIAASFKFRVMKIRHAGVIFCFSASLVAAPIRRPPWQLLRNRRQTTISLLNRQLFAVQGDVPRTRFGPAQVRLELMTGRHSGGRRWTAPSVAAAPPPFCR